VVNCRITLLLTGSLAALAGCSRQAAPPADLWSATALYLQRTGNFSPTEAKAIAAQIERGPRDLSIQVTAAGRDGILLKLDDLQAPLPPPERNAAPIYVELTRLLNEKPIDPAMVKVIGSLTARVRHSPQELDAVRQLLSERQDVLHLVHTAASKPDSVFQRDWSRGLTIDYPEFPAMRAAARLLNAESYFLVRDGQFPEAVGYQAQVFRVVQHSTTDPCIIAQLVGIACDLIALAGMENILCAAGPNPGVDDAVRTAVSAGRPHLQLRRALEGEIALYSAGMNCMRGGAPAADPTHQRLKRLYGSGSSAMPADAARNFAVYGNVWSDHATDAAQAYYLRLVRSLIAAGAKPYPACRSLLAQVRHLAEAQPRSPVEQLASPGPVLGESITKLAQARAQEEAIIAGAAVLAYRGRHRSFPTRLEQAIPRAPDPFGIGPLKYRRESSGFVVYSIGPDGNFGGGAPGMWRARDQAYFRFPATPPPQ
jgi:hypothetical protein